MSQRDDDDNDDDDDDDVNRWGVGALSPVIHRELHQGYLGGGISIMMMMMMMSTERDSGRRSGCGSTPGGVWESAQW